MARRCWPWAWRIYLTTAISAFTYLEWVAYTRHKHPTLSRELQYWTGYRPRRPWGLAGPFVFAAFGAWLTQHLMRLDEELPAKADYVPGGTA